MRTIAAVIGLALLFAPGAAAQEKQRCSFESLVNLAKTQGPPSTLAARFVRVLGFPNVDLPVTRLGRLHEATDTFRTIDLPTGSSDVIMFVRAGTNAVFWRLSKSGALRLTVVATAHTINLIDNAIYREEYYKHREYFCELVSPKE